MRTGAFMARESFAHLPRLLRDAGAAAGLESVAGIGSLRAARADPPLLPFAIPQLDTTLGGGLKRAALHEIRSGESRDATAMTGFAVAILARLAAGNARPLLWIVEHAVAGETGLPYGGGLRAFGIDPARVIVVRVTRPLDALWVFEEGLRSSGLLAVVAELYGNPRLLDLTASRRLALRAAEHAVTGLLLRPSAEPMPGAASTRWRVAPLPSAPDAIDPEGIGHPAWRLTLERNRQGTTGTFDVEWNHDRRCFAVADPAHTRPVAPLSRDRPPPPPVAGQIVALPARIHREDLPREQRRRQLQARG